MVKEARRIDSKPSKRRIKGARSCNITDKIKHLIKGRKN